MKKNLVFSICFFLCCLAVTSYAQSDRIFDFQRSCGLNNNFFTQDTIRVNAASYNLDAGAGPTSYLWNTGATSRTINVSGTGWYSCKISTSTCTEKDSVFVYFLYGNIINNDTSICKGASINLSAIANTNIMAFDIDGNLYPSTLIGNQTWTTKNLTVSRYKNGDIIPYVSDSTQWANLTSGAWCWYKNDSATYANIYGKIYNWYALNDPRGMVPDGWRLPNEKDWNLLVKNIDVLSDTSAGSVIQSRKAGALMKESGLAHWLSPNTGATNNTGFTSLPAGKRNSNGSFGALGTQSYFWSATSAGSLISYYRAMNYNDSNFVKGSISKATGFSIRLIKDSSNINFAVTTLWSNGSTANNITVTPTTTTTYYYTVKTIVTKRTASSTAGIGALDGSARRFRYASVYDWDCCLFGQGYDEGQPYPVDGHFRIRYNNAGQGFISESTGNYATRFPLGSAYNDNFGYSPNPIYKSLVTNPGCCNGDGSRIYVLLSDEITDTSVILTYKDSVKITVYATVPTAPLVIIGATDVCASIGMDTASIPVSFKVNKVANATSYFWTVPAGSTLLSGQGDTAVLIRFSASFVSGSITVKSMNSCGLSSVRSLTIYKRVAAQPGLIQKSFTPSTAAVTSVCGLVSETYRIRKVLYATSYNWSLKNGLYAAITHLNGTGINDTAILVTFLAGFTIDSLTVKAMTPCSGSASRTIALNATLAPPAITALTGNFTPCIGNTLTYTATSAVPTASQSTVSKYRWTKPLNTSIVSANSDSSSVSIMYNAGFTGGSISVKTQSACGITGAAKTVTLQYLPPTPSSILSRTGAYNACIGDTITYTIVVPSPSISQRAASVYRWTKPNNTIILLASSDSSSVKIKFNTGYTGGVLSVKGQTACGALGSAKSQTLTHTSCPVGTRESSIGFSTLNNEEVFDIIAYPNPSKSSFQLKISGVSKEQIILTIYNALGQRVSINNYNNSNNIKPIGEELPKGIYFLECRQGAKTKMLKLQKW